MKIKKRTYISKMIMIMLCLSVITFITFTCYASYLQEPSVDSIPIVSKELDSTIHDLTSEHAILIQVDNHEKLFTKEETAHVAPASLTKMVSTIIAIEYYQDYNKRLTVSQEDLDDLFLAESSLAGFLSNEEVPIEDLLYGAMLSSGGDAIMTLVRDISGNQEDFVSLMNQKAKELSLHNTHFTNACGFDDPDHYSSVEDIATILQYCLENSTFKEIFTSANHLTAPTNRHIDGIMLASTMFTNINSYSLDNGIIVGGKTGYTQNAGLSLASLAAINGKEYIFISTNATGDHSTPPYHIQDALTAYRSL